jgi:hypothetical protein
MVQINAALTCRQIKGPDRVLERRSNEPDPFDIELQAPNFEAD